MSQPVAISLFGGLGLVVTVVGVGYCVHSGSKRRKRAAYLQGTAVAMDELQSGGSKASIMSGMSVVSQGSMYYQ